MRIIYKKNAHKYNKIVYIHCRFPQSFDFRISNQFRNNAIELQHYVIPQTEGRETFLD